MQAVQLAIMQALIKLIIPTSPAYGNTVAFEKPQTHQDLQAKLRPGDIVFSRTDSSLYEMTRKYMNIKYDHVAVVINSKEVIHISPPIISKIQMGYIIHPRRQPMVIRPKLEDVDRLLTVVHNFLGEKYNTSAIPGIALRELASKLQKQNKIRFSMSNLKYSRICSDAVIYSLSRASSKISQYVEQQISKTRYPQLGFFMPDEVADILLANDGEIIIKSNFQKQYKIVDKICEGSQKIFDLVSKINLVRAKKQNISVNKQLPVRQQKTYQIQKEKSKFQYLQILSLLMALGHILGVSINNKIQYIMLALNMIMMLGHYAEYKSYTRSHPNI